MKTFSEIREFVKKHHKLVHDEPFLIGIEPNLGKRRQSLFLAEIKDRDGRNFLRLETPIAPLAAFDAEKCLRINLLLRLGTLAVGDLEGVPYIKLCANYDYESLTPALLTHGIDTLAPLADEMEQALGAGADFS